MKKTEVASALIKFRKENKLTRAELAEKIGISLNAITSVENCRASTTGGIYNRALNFVKALKFGYKVEGAEAIKPSTPAQIVSVEFKRSNFGPHYHQIKYYDYIAPSGGVRLGDHVIVDSLVDGYALAVVKIVSGFDSSRNLKEIVCRVDDSDYRERFERKAKLEEMKTSLLRKAREKQKQLVFDQLLAEDEEYKKFIEMGGRFD